MNTQNSPDCTLLTTKGEEDGGRPLLFDILESGAHFQEPVGGVTKVMSVWFSKLLVGG